MIKLNLFFHWKTKKIHVFTNSGGNQFSRVNWVITKFDLEFPDTCGDVTGNTEICEMFSGPNQGVNKSKRAKNTPFWYNFDPIKPCYP